MQRLDRHFQILGRSESDLFAGLDLDCFSGSRIAPHASCPLPDLEDAETGNSDSFALFKMLCDFANEIAEEGFTSPLRQLMLLGQGRSKMLERNGRLVLAAAGDFAALSE